MKNLSPLVKGINQEQDFNDDDHLQKSFNGELSSESKDLSTSYFSKVHYPSKKADTKSKRAKQEEQPSLSLFQDKIENYFLHNYPCFKYCVL